MPRKLVLALLSVLFFSAVVVSQTPENVEFVVELENVQVQGGKVYLAIYDSEASLKTKTMFYKTVLEPVEGLLRLELQLPEGFYYFTVYQDSNDNEELDTGFFGIPKEPVGISNYDGKGIPGGFNKHKVDIRGEAEILVKILLYKI